MLLHRDFGIVARSADGDEREFNVIASTPAVDSYDEIIEQSGWDLRRYNANPVVLLQHDAGGLPIGHAKNTRVEGGKLRATIRVVDQRAHPMAEQILHSVKQGSLRGVSVGFRPLEHETKKIGGREIVVVKRAELLEISLVVIGANPEAVVERSLTKARATKALHELTPAEHLAEYRRDRAGYVARLRTAMEAAKTTR